jgi:predicted metalloprotease with PDZ domain
MPLRRSRRRVYPPRVPSRCPIPIRAARAASAAIALGLVAPGCHGRGAGAGAADAGAEAAFAGITLDLRPDPDHREVAVEVRVSGERAAAVREITVARRWADTRAADVVDTPRARDAEGEIPLARQPDDGGTDEVYTLARAPAGGEVTIRYRARAAVDHPGQAGAGGRSRLALRVGPDRMTGVGHAFLVLPRLDERLPARIRTHVEALGRGADAVSSFGFGAEVAASATSEELSHAVYLAGMIWREADPGGSGTQLFVLGNPPIDTRKALDHALAARTAVDGFFRAQAADPLTFVLVAQPGLGRGHDGAYLGRSLGVFVDAEQPLDGALDLIVAHELTHRFLGGALRVVGPDGREAAWFSEGFTVHFARRALLDAGLLSPADYVADVRRTLGAGDERLPAEYRRGALHAAALDAELRRASQGRRSLDDVVRALLASAPGALPVSALRDASARELGPTGADRVDRLAAGDEAPVDLPDDAFGPCVRRVSRAAFDLGFDRRSLSLSPAVVVGLSPGSPAARAGLREGALVTRARIPSEADALGPARAEVELVLAGGKRVRFHPVGSRREKVWEPADCRPRAQSSR